MIRSEHIVDVQEREACTGRAYPKRRRPDDHHRTNTPEEENSSEAERRRAPRPPPVHSSERWIVGAVECATDPGLFAKFSRYTKVVPRDKGFVSSKTAGVHSAKRSVSNNLFFPCFAHTGTRHPRAPPSRPLASFRRFERPARSSAGSSTTSVVGTRRTREHGPRRRAEPSCDERQPRLIGHMKNRQAHPFPARGGRADSPEQLTANAPPSSNIRCHFAPPVRRFQETMLPRSQEETGQ